MGYLGLSFVLIAKFCQSPQMCVFRTEKGIWWDLLTCNMSFDKWYQPINPQFHVTCAIQFLKPPVSCRSGKRIISKCRNRSMNSWKCWLTVFIKEGDEWTILGYLAILLITWKPSNHTIGKHLTLKKTRKRWFQTIYANCMLLAHVTDNLHLKLWYALLSHHKWTRLIFVQP